MRHAPRAQDIELVRDRVAGRRIVSLSVYGVNALKTLDPPIDDLVGDEVKDLVAQEGTSHVEMICRDHTVDIDLARTGRLTTLPHAAPWSPSNGGPMPTARVIFDDGSGLDFREPAKTKRIALSVRRR